MQVLIFKLGNDRYGLHTGAVVRVLPLLEFTHIPQVPDYVAGLMNYHGAAVPVIDLSRLSSGHAFAPCFDSRILLVHYPTAAGPTVLLGLIAEHVIGLQNLDQAAFAPSGIATPSAPYLGQITTGTAGILQLVDVAHLLPPELHAILFQPAADTAPC